MKYRTLGRTGIQVSEIGFGTWSMGSMWGARNDALATEALNLALDLGVNFFDTAYVYGDGHSESLIGNVVRKRKEKVFIATKVPPKDHNWPARLGSDPVQIFPASWIRTMTEKSLKNLGLECVDLQQLHVWAPNWLSHERVDGGYRGERGFAPRLKPASGFASAGESMDWLGELEKLRKEGKIRFIGISINDHRPDTALEIVKSGLIDAVQVIYNIFDQSPKKNLLPLCREHRVGVIVRVPFDEGGLTGTLTPQTQFDKKDWRRFYFKGDRLRETCERAEKLKAFLSEDVKTLPELALRYCLSHPAVATVIPGMRRPEHVRASTAVSDGKLLPEKTLTALKAHAWPRSFYPNWEDEGL